MHQLPFFHTDVLLPCYLPPAHRDCCLWKLYRFPFYRYHLGAISSLYVHQLTLRQIPERDFVLALALLDFARLFPHGRRARHLRVPDPS